MAFPLLEVNSRGILHRDFRPDNMLFYNSDGIEYIILSDFGISKYSKSTQKINTGKNGYTGNFHFVSPERFDCNSESEKEDAWALGATLF
jgi:serine/threonine kinase PknH